MCGMYVLLKTPPTHEAGYVSWRESPLSSTGQLEEAALGLIKYFATARYHSNAVPIPITLSLSHAEKETISLI